MSFEQTIVRSDARPLNSSATAALLLAVAALAFDGGRLALYAYTALRFPWELDYGEGIVWEQMRLMLDGRGYGSISGLPAIVFHYPPLFHMTTAGLAGVTGLDDLAAGRLVSAASSVLIGLFAGLIAHAIIKADSPKGVSAICGVVAGLSVFSFWPIAYWAPLMRVDMLATALSLGGIYAAMLAFKRPPMILLAATCFVAAVFTKQTSVVAPAAVFLTYLLIRPRLAWVCAASCTGLGLAILGALAWATDGGFLRHIFLYNVNRFEAWRLLWIKDAVLTHILYFAVIGLGVTARLRTRLAPYRDESLATVRLRLAATPADAFFLLGLVYAGLAGLMTLSIAKSGSNANYFIEWMAVLSVLLGVSVREAAAAAFGASHDRAQSRLFAQPALLPLMIGIQALIVAPPPDYKAQRDPARVADLEALSAQVRAAERPVISDDMVLLARSGVPVSWEPAIFAELASTGAWNESGFVQHVRAQQFAFFVTVGERGQRLFDSRYNPAVAEAIAEAYPVRREVAGYTIHEPAKQRAVNAEPFVQLRTAP
jgi:uncharacterized membrane protein YeaQ/YmgE (transglycosylase-associated protein family)